MPTGMKLEAVNLYALFFFSSATNFYYTIDINIVLLANTYADIDNLENKECVCSFITLCKN